MGVIDGYGEEAGLLKRGGGCRGNASLGGGGGSTLRDGDQSQWQEFYTDEEPLASSCNSAMVQVVSKLWVRKTNTIDLISTRRPSMNLMVKYIGSVLEE